jgi:DNA polymerase IV
LPERWIAHVDMDAFYASIEVRDDPSLRGKPVVVGGAPGVRGVVAAASYEARRFGIRSAMPMARALRQCPDLVILPVDMIKYKYVSDQIMLIFDQYSPLVEPLSLDEAFLDLSGTEHVHGPVVALGCRIKEVIRATTGLTASVGIAPRKFVAKIASDLRKPDGLVVVGQGEVEAFLAPLPIGRLWGVGPKTLEHLEAMGVGAIGDLARLGKDDLSRRFGAWGERLLDLALGRDDRGVVPEWEAKSYSHEETFPSDRGDAQFLAAVMLDQSCRVARRLRRAGAAGQIVTVKIRYGDFKTITRQRRLPRPTSLAEEIYGEAKQLFVAAWDGRPLRLIGVGVSQAESREEAGLLFPQERIRERSRRLAETVDRIQEKFGTRKMIRAPSLLLAQDGPPPPKKR